MARRYFGDLAINVVYKDYVNNQDRYAVSVSGHGVSWKHSLYAGAGGFGRGIAYDSQKAYDEMAKTAVSFATTPDGSESPEDREIMAILEDAANSGPNAGRFHRPKTGSKKNPIRRTARRTTRRNPSQAFNVYLNGRLIDTVFQSGPFTTEEVKRSLVNHDGYDPRIVVKKQRKR